MLTKRIIPCLDVKDGKVVKGIQFKNHQLVGEVENLALYYCLSGADELVFYDISASSNQKTVSYEWVKKVAKCIDIPFCVAGGISTIEDAELILNAGADKISINSPALDNPDLINIFSETFGKQCVVLGIDSLEINGVYQVMQYTGDETKTKNTMRATFEWIKEGEMRGAGEIVLNCMNQDGMRKGYDLKQLTLAKKNSTLPMIASGGAGNKKDFLNVFEKTNVDGALAASVFHSKEINILELKTYLSINKIEMRI